MIIAIVNEHPRNIGKRNISFIKITSIPNVYMASYDIKSLEIVKESSLVIVLSGSLGFESALLKKPVICLGNTMYNMLPQNIVRKVSSLKDLFKNITDLLYKYQYDEKVIINYISSIINNSVKINFYNVLLTKNRNGKSNELKTFEENIYQLKKLIQKKIKFGA